MQTSYSQNASAAVAGMIADAATELLPGASRSAQGPTVQGVSVAVGSVANSTLYRITVNHTSNAAATYGQTLSTNCDYTSDSDAAKAEILAGLLAAVNAASVPVTASCPDAANGPLTILADQARLEFTLTLSANLSQSDDSGEIPFGVAVCMDGAEDKVRLPQVSADVALTLGVAVRTLAQENNLEGTNVYPINSSIRVLRKGRIWVQVEEAVALGDAAYVRFEANGANTQLGAFRKSVDSSTAVALTGAKFMSAAGAGELAILELNL